tara:strand:- start:345 stop:746 length:402 start_codon:yes stop_codon:yes gene_type:complete
MNQEHLNRLDFTNEALNNWLNDCPFPITNFRQMCFETKGQKQVELLVDIPIEKTAANLAHYNLSLDDKTADLEIQYIRADKRHKELIAESIKLEQEGKVLEQRKIDQESYLAWKKVQNIGRQLNEISGIKQKH